jgi:hypothetical protein
MAVSLHRCPTISIIGITHPASVDLRHTQSFHAGDAARSINCGTPPRLWVLTLFGEG